jgi:hypothetical protein
MSVDENVKKFNVPMIICVKVRGRVLPVRDCVDGKGVAYVYLDPKQDSGYSYETQSV